MAAVQPAIPHAITDALANLREAWDNTGAPEERLEAWLHVVNRFLTAKASGWSTTDVSAVAVELEHYSVLLESGLLLRDFDEGLVRREDESDGHRSPSAGRTRRDRSPRRRRYTSEEDEEHSISKASGPPHYKLQRLHPF
ncbi:hypothetical protein JCM10449v2_005254 [Rhodotorula kratochvilovae]